MRAGIRVAAMTVTAALALAAPATGDENRLPANPAEALERAKPAIEAARTAKAGETPEIVKGIQRAVELMQPQVKAGSADAQWAAVWNELLTLARFHGRKPTAEYVMEPHSILSRIACATPVGRGWRWKEGQSGPNLQSVGEIQRVLADGTVAAAVRVSRYSFNVVYSGIDGADSSGLAELFFGIHRADMAKVDSRSPKVLAKPLSKGFKRASFFEVVGTIPEGERRRIRSYFVKTSSNTYEFDAIEYRGAVPEGSPPVVDWQRNVQDPELDAVLDSIEEREPDKKR